MNRYVYSILKRSRWRVMDEILWTTPSRLGFGSHWKTFRAIEALRVIDDLKHWLCWIGSLWKWTSR